MVAVETITAIRSSFDPEGINQGMQAAVSYVREGARTIITEAGRIGTATDNMAKQWLTAAASAQRLVNSLDGQAAAAQRYSTAWATMVRGVALGAVQVETAEKALGLMQQRLGLTNAMLGQNAAIGLTIQQNFSRLVSIFDPIGVAAIKMATAMTNLNQAQTAGVTIMGGYAGALERIKTAYEEASIGGIGFTNRAKESLIAIKEGSSALEQYQTELAQVRQRGTAAFDPLTASVLKMTSELRALNETQAAGVTIAGGYEAAKEVIIAKYDEGAVAAKKEAAALAELAAQRKAEAASGREAFSADQNQAAFNKSVGVTPTPVRGSLAGPSAEAFVNNFEEIEKFNAELELGMKQLDEFNRAAALESERLTTLFDPATASAREMTSKLRELNAALAASVNIAGGYEAAAAAIIAKYDEGAIAAKNAANAVDALAVSYAAEAQAGRDAFAADQTQQDYNKVLGVKQAPARGTQAAPSADVFSAEFEKETERLDAATAAYERYLAKQEETLAENKRLVASYDPLTVAAEAYRKTLDDIAKAQARGLLNPEQAVVARQDAVSTHRNVIDQNDETSIKARNLATENERLTKTYNPLRAAQEAYGDKLAEIDTSLERGIVNQREANIQYSLAQQELSKQTKAARELGEEHEKLGGNLRTTGFATSGITREFLVLGHEMVTGNFTRFFGSIMVMAEYMTQLGGAVGKVVAKIFDFIFSWKGAAALGVGLLLGGLVAMAVHAENAALRIARLQLSLRGARDDFVEMTKSAEDASRVLLKTTSLSVADAHTVTGAIVRSPDFQGNTQNIVNLSKDVQAFGNVLGLDIPAASEKFVAAMADPGKAAEDLIGRLKGFDRPFADHLKELQDRGKQSEAFTEFLEKERKASEGARKPLTELDDAIQKLSQTFAGTTQEGREFNDSLGGAIDRNVARILRGLNKVLAAMTEAGNWLDRQSSGGVGPDGLSPVDKEVVARWEMERRGLVPIGITPGSTGGRTTSEGLSPDVPTTSEGVGRNLQRSINAAQAAYTSGGSLSAQIQANQNLQAVQIAGIEAAEKQAVTLADDAKAMDLNTAATQHFREELQKLQGVATDLDTTQRLAARSAEDAIKPLQARLGAERELATARQRAVELARSAGTPVDEAALARVQTAILQGLRLEFGHTIDEMNRESAATELVARAWDDGAEAASKVTIANQAVTDSLRIGTNVTKLDTDALLDRTKAMERLNLAQARSTTRDQIALIKLETDTIGQNKAARQDQIDHLKNFLEVERSFADLPPVERRARVEQLDTLSRLDRLKAARESINDEKVATRDQIALIQLETDTIGKNGVARQAQLEHLKAVLEVERSFPGLSQPEKDARVSQLDTLNAMTQLNVAKEATHEALIRAGYAYKIALAEADGAGAVMKLRQEMERVLEAQRMSGNLAALAAKQWEEQAAAIGSVVVKLREMSQEQANNARLEAAARQGQAAYAAEQQRQAAQPILKPLGLMQPANSNIPLATSSLAAPAVPSVVSGGSGAAGMSTIKAPGGASFTVATSAAPAFQGLINELEGAGYLIGKTSSYRPGATVANTGLPSMHASGLAIDINPSRNAVGTSGDIPAEIARGLAARYGMAWGGDFRVPDPMHFGFDGRMSPGGAGAAGVAGTTAAPVQALTPAMASALIAEALKQTSGAAYSAITTRLGVAISGGTGTGEIGKQKQDLIAAQDQLKVAGLSNLEQEKYLAVTRLQRQEQIDLRSVVADTATKTIAEQKQEIQNRYVILTGLTQETLKQRELAMRVEELSSAGRSVGQAFGTAFESLIIDGAKGSDVLVSLAKDIAKIGFELTLVKPLMTMFGNLASGNDAMSGVGGIFSFLGKGGGTSSTAVGASGFTVGEASFMSSAAQASTAGFMVGHIGGVVGQDNFPTRDLPIATFANAPRLHSGLGGDEFAAILQRGERVLTRGQQDAVMAGSRGGSTTVQVNTPITVNAPSGGKPIDPTAAKQLQAQLDRTVKQAVRSVLTDERRDGGDLYR